LAGLALSHEWKGTPLSLETTQRSPALAGVKLRRRRAQTAGSAVLFDFLDGFERWHLWRALAWKDIRGRYRRTVIGPFWTALNTAIFVAALGAVYALLWHQSVSTYLPYFCAGYISWYFFLTIVNESCLALIAEGETVKAIRVPYSVFIFRVIARNVIVFFHNVAIYVIVALIFKVHWGWGLLLLPVGFLFILPNYFWVALFLATICSRFRDVIQLVSNLTQILFFVTPIFWQASDLQHNPIADFLFVKANPAYRFVEVIRAPLLGQVPSLGTYYYLVLMMVLGGGVTFFLLRRVYGRIAYWL
jgi:homopolymeric O-antigen transport system permease protein